MSPPPQTRKWRGNTHTFRELAGDEFADLYDLLHVGGALARCTRRKGKVEFEAQWSTICDLADRALAGRVSGGPQESQRETGAAGGGE